MRLRVEMRPLLLPRFTHGDWTRFECMFSTEELASVETVGHHMLRLCV